MFLLPFKFLKKTKRRPHTRLDNDTGGDPIPKDPGEEGIQGQSVLLWPQEFITGGVMHLTASGNEKMSFLKDVINRCS